VFRFIIEYSSLRDFGPYLIGLFFYEDFWNMIFWLVFKPEISYRVIISWRTFVSFRGCFEDYIFCMVSYLSFHNSSLALRYFWMLMARAQWDTPLVMISKVFSLYKMDALGHCLMMHTACNCTCQQRKVCLLLCFQ
jgi:hypothetical protein